MKVIKRRIELVILLGMMNAFTALSQSGLNWAREISGTSVDIAQSVVAGNNERVYAAGAFKQQISFGSGNLVSSAGLGDMFIAGYDASGKLLWSKVAGGAGMDMVRSLAVDPDENLISAGCFEGQIDLDPGAGVMMAGNTGNQSVFVSKFSSAGELIWGRHINSTEFITCNSVKADNIGNVYFTGSFKTEVDFDPGAGTALYRPQGRMRDLYVVKLDAAGNFLWVRTFPVICDDIGTGFVVDEKNEVLVAGSFYGTDPVDLDPSSASYMVSPKGSEDLLLIKLSPAGDMLWANHLAGTFYNARAALAVNNNSEIYFAGNFYGTVDVDPGTSIFNLISNGPNPDAFIAKFAADGKFIWAQHVGGLDVQQTNAITVSENSEVILTGLFQGSMDADPGQNAVNLYSAGKEDVFIIRFDANGEFMCAGNMGGAGSDRAGGVQFDRSGNLFLTGSFSQTADLDPGTGTYMVTPQNDNDLYVCKISSCLLSTSLMHEKRENEVRVFPNPTKGELTVFSASGEYTVLRVLNVLGTEVVRQPLKTGNNAVHLGDLPKGVYFVCLMREDELQPLVRKVLVQ